VSLAELVVGGPIVEHPARVRRTPRALRSDREAICD
jgi:hypothetical protein